MADNTKTPPRVNLRQGDAPQGVQGEGLGDGAKKTEKPKKAKKADEDEGK